MNLEKIYTDAGAYLQGHFLLSSGNHSKFYLQSAKVLENPELAGKLADELFSLIKSANIALIVFARQHLVAFWLVMS